MKKFALCSLMLGLLCINAQAQQLVAVYPSDAVHKDHYGPADIPIDNLDEIVYASRYPKVDQHEYSNMIDVINLDKPVLLSIKAPGMSVMRLSEMNQEKRQELIHKIVAFIEKIQAKNPSHKTFAGVNLNWQHGGNQWRFAMARGGRARLSNTIAFLRSLKNALPHHSNTLAITVPSDPDVVLNVDKQYNNQFWSSVARTVNQMFVLTYGYHRDLTSQNRTNFDAPLYFDPTQPMDTLGRDRFNVSSSIQAYLQANVPSDHLFLTISTYGKLYSDVPAAGKPLGTYQYFSKAAQTRIGHGLIKYRAIINDPAFAKHVDNDAGEMAAYDRTNGTFASFDTPETARTKRLYAQSVKLAGVMISDLPGDAPVHSKASLIRALYQH